ncbi:MAG: ATP-binding protein [Cyclobacteriaceae bacterium]|nr:ATP-binding protein [Cyclobacteriaceae bacterium HetDA_MAG_MS6]
MQHNLIIPCSKEKLSSVREFLSEVLEQHSFPELESHKLILAVDEVCANLIIHANNCNPKEHLELHVDFIPNSKISFTIRDRGIGFDINQYNEPSIGEIVSAKRKGGLGLMLVKRIMDKIEFSTENNYNICRLIKNI